MLVRLEEDVLLGGSIANSGKFFMSLSISLGDQNSKPTVFAILIEWISMTNIQYVL